LFSPLDHAFSTLKISHHTSSANAVLAPRFARLTEKCR